MLIYNQDKKKIYRTHGLRMEVWHLTGPEKTLKIKNFNNCEISWNK